MSRPGERKEILWALHAAQRVTSNRDKIVPLPTERRVESRRYQDRLVDQAAHGGDPADFVYRRPNHGEIKPFAAAEIAVDDFAGVKAEIDVGRRQSASKGGVA